MIRLERIRTAGTIVPGLRGAALRRKNATLLAALAAGTPPAKLSFNSDYWKAGKAQLKAESHGKCAYCEAQTDVVAHGDVEHFRPKSIYWWLAYCYDNHLFSCQICNQTYKGNKFPVSGAALAAPVQVPAGATAKQIEALLDRLAPDPLDIGGAYPLEHFRALCAGELADLPDPYVDDPEQFFIWEADETLKEVAIAPAKKTARLKAIFKAVDDCFGLNREQLRGIRDDQRHNPYPRREPRRSRRACR